jgi:hypothetical protein
MENINMGGQISSADFGQFSLGVYTTLWSALDRRFRDSFLSR